MRSLYIFLYFFSFSLLSQAQNLSCSDFKLGSFTIPKSENMPLEFIVERNGNQQWEQAIDVPDSLSQFFPKEKQYFIINWVGKCEYNLLHDDTKHKLEPFQKAMDDNGGLKVKIKRIDGRCAFYEATANADGQPITVTAKLCKN